MAKTSRIMQTGVPLAADLFCGSGSVSQALRASGLKLAFAVDNDASARATYVLNHPDVEFYHQDIREVDLTKAMETLAGRPLSVLAVCAPCQPFSSQNRKRSFNDARAPLVLEAVRFAEALKPETIWVENVPGIVRSGAKQELRQGLASLGYDFGEPLRLSATQLGVPQRRVRSIFVASKNNLILQRLEKLRSDFTGDLPPSVREALEGLPAIGPGEKSADDELHRSRRHAPITIKRLRAIPKDGGSRSALPDHLQLACHRDLDPNSFPDVYGRMSWDSPAPTLTTGCTDVTRGRFAHPLYDRAITLREAARLQTFPDGYQFSGSSTEIARLIGNAVPYEMARRIFDWLLAGKWPPEINEIKAEALNC